MNPQIEKLRLIAAKAERRIIGLMSGTSLDGLDVAVCLVKGSGFETQLHMEHFETVPYHTIFKDEIRSVCFKENVSLQKLTLLNKNIAVQHANIINELLRKWKVVNNAVDLIASHGQTIYHAPLQLHGNTKDGSATLQIGDGDFIAANTGIITISDFRQKHISAGGEGAPLAAYGDMLLFREKDNDVLLLNIGGISNFTFIPANGQVISSDIGPGNTLMDQWIKHHFPEKDFDEGAAFARQGTVNYALLNTLKDDLFFKLSLPKTTGPELFNTDFIEKGVKKCSQSVAPKDVMATLCRLTADTICDALRSLNMNDNTKIYLSGGGIHNPLLIEMIREGLHVKIGFTSEKNIDPDAKEAVLFALLANECVAGDTKTFEGISPLMPAVSMGKISLP